MTDHIPLAEARPGDMVFPAPQKIVTTGPEGVWTRGGRYDPEEIDHIERPARVLKVGEPAMWFGGRVEVLAFHQGRAWVRDQRGYFNSPPLTDLEPVE